MSSFERENVHETLIYQYGRFLSRKSLSNILRLLRNVPSVLTSAREIWACIRGKRAVPQMVGVLNVPVDTVLPSIGFIMPLV